MTPPESNMPDQPAWLSAWAERFGITPEQLRANIAEGQNLTPEKRQADYNWSQHPGFDIDPTTGRRFIDVQQNPGGTYQDDLAQRFTIAPDELQHEAPGWVKAMPFVPLVAGGAVLAAGALGAGAAGAGGAAGAAPAGASWGLTGGAFGTGGAVTAADLAAATAGTYGAGAAGAGGVSYGFMDPGMLAELGVSPAGTQIGAFTPGVSEAALGGLGGEEPLSYSGFTPDQGGIGSFGAGPEGAASGGFDWSSITDYGKDFLKQALENYIKGQAQGGGGGAAGAGGGGGSGGGFSSRVGMIPGTGDAPGSWKPNQLPIGGLIPPGATNSVSDAANALAMTLAQRRGPYG